MQVISGLYDWPPGEFADRVERQVAVPGFTIVYAAGSDVVARSGDRVAVPRFTLGKACHRSAGHLFGA